MIVIQVTGQHKKLLKGVEVQNVNSNQIYPSDIDGILQQLDIDYKRVNCAVVAVDLVDNIQPHDDRGYCMYEGYRKAVFVVTHCVMGKNAYADSCQKNYLYGNGDFVELCSGYGYRFNPKKQHAVIVSGRVKGFVIFY